MSKLNNIQVNDQSQNDDYKCTNEKCGWTGSRSEMLSKIIGNLYKTSLEEVKVCPVCKGAKNYDISDYDIGGLLVKARKWDDLEAKIAKYYEDDCPDDCLLDIGEAAAIAFGFMG